MVLRMMNTPELEGVWMIVNPDRPFRAHYLASDRHVELVPTGTVEWSTTEFAATGALEWDGNACAEVYVPSDRLGQWKAEHEYPEESPWIL